MSSDKRDFTNFKDFPGEINLSTNNYEFPTLYVSSSTGKIRQWSIYIRLIKKSSKKANLTKEQNWNLLEEDQVNIKSNYLNDNGNFPEGLLAQVWTESGQIDGKISRCAPTYTDIKNKGKKNERHVFHQALVLARGKYLKKLQEGSLPIKEFKELNSNNDKTKKTVLSSKNIMYFPMLAKNFSDFENKINYPIYIQPKLDGLRCIIYLNPGKKDINNTNYTDVIMYTRQKKEYPHNSSNDNIRRALYPILHANYDVDEQESLYLDGEIYKHGKSLQDINSESRTSDIKYKKSKGTDEYHLYDMFFPSYTDEPFSERIEFLKDLYHNLTQNEKIYIKLVPTHLVKTRKMNDEIYKKYISKGYEGIMIRNIGGPYAKSAINKSSSIRSKNLLKRKEIFEEEFEIVGFTEGSMGKDVGAVIWICSTADGKTFHVTPNMSYDERYKIYKDCKKNFINKYQGRMLKVEFRGVSDDNKPQQAKGLIIRDIM
jgi:ATP-dependent DNA ligase